MRSIRSLRAAVAIVLAVVFAGSAGLLIRSTLFRPNTVAAEFVSATGIYPGDEVRVSGVKVGRIVSIVPQGTWARIAMTIQHDVKLPAGVSAVIVAQNLVSARYIQLTPAYESGPTLRGGATIPLERTAVPVEWDEVKVQLMRLATDLGPTRELATPSVARFIDSAANAMQGNGNKLRQALAQLSGVGRILAEGSGNIVDVIKNLQTFVTALRDSKIQIVQFEDRLATLSSVLDDNRSDLDAALTNLSQAVGEVQRFVNGTRDKTSEQIQRLADVTQNLVDHRRDLEQVLHVAPSAAANAYSMYNPDTGTEAGSFVINNFSNPIQFVCDSIGAIENTTAPETAKLCAQYLGPALKTMNFNYMPIPINFFLQKSASPANLIYTEPRLAPGGAGPKPVPPETPPAVSAYTGLNGDVPPPARFGEPPVVGPGPQASEHLPAFPSPVYPPPPAPAPPRTAGDLLLPAGHP